MANFKEVIENVFSHGEHKLDRNARKASETLALVFNDFKDKRITKEQASELKKQIEHEYNMMEVASRVFDFIESNVYARDKNWADIVGTMKNQVPGPELELTMAGIEFIESVYKHSTTPEKQ